jgi:hypothetical protein
VQSVPVRIGRGALWYGLAIALTIVVYFKNGFLVAFIVTASGIAVGRWIRLRRSRNERTP